MIKPKPTSILSIDFGRKRIGLAGCDPLGLSITELPAIYRASYKKDLATIKAHCLYRKVNGLIVGLPLDENGKLTNQAIHCQNYGIKIASELDLPLAWVNEHSSSWEAGHKYNLQNDRTGKLDSAVAGLLLEQWLREGPDLLPISKSNPSKTL
ncbi:MULTISPECIES: Holliday junction resolvase RuvX [unclassified Prochlorococcus]|uniref:Holliday junction resolvase RuvX n=1 Tax=unclassified Prochlorococcus TaxID=2627481 RepID=UPI0005337249|nr:MULTISPECIES: Holliday junction resolvase RuvX [unclassified Prochlorococcus]KGG15184.1 putative Holliday junction resolvase [Prochlorococcus sp. MIT 0602]KGG17458.1 putative Holliday junction resolvase [Prochlorococcus sp. MIT 0603]